MGELFELKGIETTAYTMIANLCCRSTFIIQLDIGRWGFNLPYSVCIATHFKTFLNENASQKFCLNLQVLYFLSSFIIMMSYQTMGLVSMIAYENIRSGSVADS